MLTRPSTNMNRNTAHMLTQSEQPDSNKESMTRTEMDAFLNDALLELRQAELVTVNTHWQWSQTELPHHTFVYMHKFTGKLVANGIESLVARKSAFLCTPGTSLELYSDTNHENELYIIHFDLFRVAEKTKERRIYERELGLCNRMDSGPLLWDTANCRTINN